MTTPSDGWTIDCGHWHCPDRYDLRHAHHVTVDACPECAEQPPRSERAHKLEAKAMRIGGSKFPVLNREEGDRT